MKNFKYPINSGLPVALLSLLAVSCQVDKTYSLDKIENLDTEMTLFSNELEVPVGNVKAITLGSIFKEFDDNDMIYTDEDGNYGIRVSGNGTTSTDIDVPSITLAPFQAGKANLFSYSFPSASVGMSIPSFSEDMAIENKKSTISIENDLPDEVIDLAYVNINAPLEVNFIVSSGYLTIKKDFTFAFPSFMTISCQSGDFQVVSGNVLKAVSDIQISNGYKFNATVTKIAIPSGAIVTSGSTRKLKIDGDIVANGSVNINGAAFSTIPASVNFDYSIAAGVVSVSSASAKISVSKASDDIKVEIDQMPEVLSEASFVLSDPVVHFTVTNGTPFEVSLNANIVSKKDNSPVCSPIVISDVKVKGSATTDVYICKSSHAVPSGAVKVVAESIGELLRVMPDEISVTGVNATVQTPDFVSISTSSRYAVGMNYDVTTLLAFETGTSLGFNYTIEGLSMNFDNAEIQDMDLSMELVSTIPMDLSLNARAYDSKGGELKDANVTVNATVKGGTIVSPATSPVTINIKTGESLSNLDSIVLDFRASVPSALSGISLNEKQGIAINNIVAKVKGGITIKSEDK